MRLDQQPKFVSYRNQRGFTLVEMVAVIVITGILGGMVAIFISGPVQGYVDSARRADMTDSADVALRRMARDIRTAVPNSVRLPVPAGSAYIEFLPTKAGGRYRAQDCIPSCAGDILDFTIADTSFDILGSAISLLRGDTDDTSDQIVIGSTTQNGNPPYDKTFAGNGIRRPFKGVTGTWSNVQILGVQFPVAAELPSHRFDVVSGAQQAVTYACENVGLTNGDGTGMLRRYWSYGFNPAQVAPPLVGSSAILADKIGSCNIVYDPTQQLVSITLGITRSNDSVSLYQEIHVSNAP